MDIENNQFSKREKDVAKLLLQGKSNKQIALELGISNRTVEFHLSNIFAKLGVSSRSEAILKFTESNLREPTGDFQVKPTVDNIGDLTENGFKSILRRITLRKIYAISAGLLATLLIASFVIVNLSGQNFEPTPPTQANQAVATNINASPSTAINTQTLPEASSTPPTANRQTNIVIPSHTVNGYTATIESYYVDTSHIIFQVRLTGGKISFGSEHFYDRIGSSNLYDENGNLLNASTGWGSAIDPALYQFEFVPVTLLTGNHIKGQFAFDLNDAPDYGKVLAAFRFDFDLPVQPETRFYPKQTTSANNLAMQLDSITVTPTFTQVYLCFPPLTNAPWTLGNQSNLQIDGQEASPMYFRELFNSETGGEMRVGSEPYWVPPIKNGRCIKAGFPIGSSHPTSLVLTVPELENLEPYLRGDAYLKLPALYPGLSEKEAYFKYLEENGYTYKGSWTFKVELTP